VVPLESQGVQAWDRFAFVNNNPVRYIDPTGHCIDPDTCPEYNRNSKSNKQPDKSKYSDWYSGEYSGCKMCHYAHAQDKTILTNDELATADRNFREWAAVGYTPMLATTVSVGGLEIAGTVGANQVVNTGSNAVYRVVERGVTKYIGITMDLARRGGEHLAQKGWQIEPMKGLQNLSRFDARAVEQVLIERFGLPSLHNQINSIATKNPIYQQAIQRGLEILDKIGFK
jgi:hypothetical protein